MYEGEICLAIKGVRNGLFYGSEVCVKNREMNILQSSNSINCLVFFLKVS